MKRARPDGTSGPNLGAELTADEASFGRAMEEYKRRTGRRFPAWSEVLQVLHELGYRKGPTDAEA